MAFPFIIISKITSFFTSGFQILYLIFIKQDICIKIFRTEESLTSTAFSFKNMVAMYATNNKVHIIIKRECAKGLRRKVWTQTKILSPNIRYFVAILRFVAIYAIFGRLKARNVLFWIKNSVSWARSALLYSTYCILYLEKSANLHLRAKTTHLARKQQLRP